MNKEMLVDLSIHAFPELEPLNRDRKILFMKSCDCQKSCFSGNFHVVSLSQAVSITSDDIENLFL